MAIITIPGAGRYEKVGITHCHSYDHRQRPMSLNDKVGVDDIGPSLLRRDIALQ